MSKFQKLVELCRSDYQNTYEYTNKNFEFIKKFVLRLSEYLGCGLDNIKVTDHSLKERISIRNFFHNLIVVDDACFFNFKILIQFYDLTEAPPAFNINNCEKSFAEKRLLPPSGMILPIAIKQENDLFIIKTVDGSETKTLSKQFFIKLEEQEPFLEVFDFLFQAMKENLELGLEGRISMLKQQDRNSETSFGFVWEQQ